MLSSEQKNQKIDLRVSLDESFFCFGFLFVELSIDGADRNDLFSRVVYCEVDEVLLILYFSCYVQHMIQSFAM